MSDQIVLVLSKNDFDKIKIALGPSRKVRLCRSRNALIRAPTGFFY
jgi:hypothetical protein